MTILYTARAFPWSSTQGYSQPPPRVSHPPRVKRVSHPLAWSMYKNSVDIPWKLQFPKHSNFYPSLPPPSPTSTRTQTAYYYYLSFLFFPSLYKPTISIFHSLFVMKTTSLTSFVTIALVAATSSFAIVVRSQVNVTGAFFFSC